MKLITKDYRGQPLLYNSLEDYANCAISPDGSVEASRSDNSLAIGRLLDQLAEKGLLTAAEVGNIVVGHSADVKFVK